VDLRNDPKNLPEPSQSLVELLMSVRALKRIAQSLSRSRTSGASTRGVDLPLDAHTDSICGRTNGLVL